MNLWLIIIAILFLVGIVLLAVYGLPAIVQFHKDSLEPVRGIANNPASIGTLAALL